MTASRTGIVLSGGGARGAYEVGVIAGIVECLGLRATDSSPIQVVSGTSVGAINGTYLVANAHRGDLAVGALVNTWSELDLATHLRVDLLGLAGIPRPSLKKLFRRKSSVDELADRLGKSVLDPTALEGIVKKTISFAQLHENIERGVVRALVVAALHVGTGVTTMFAELTPGAEFQPIKHPRREARKERIEVEHVLASAAIPFLFPARRVGQSFYVDGGLRFNTPIAPAIRAGAEKLVVVSLRHDAPVRLGGLGAYSSGEEQYPNLVFLLGKIFNALLLDPVAYDLQVLDRFNRLMEALELALGPEELSRIDRVVAESRGMGYRKIDTLVFAPSEDIGVAAGDHLRGHMPRYDLGRFYEWLLGRAANVEATWEADLASYLLFDGQFAARLIDIGRRDALTARDAVRKFFGA